MKLEAASVSVRLPSGERRLILEEVSLAWQQGERIGLLGHNGSGKTTLARALAGLQGLSKGRRHGNQRVLLVLQRPEDQFTQSTVIGQIHHYATTRLHDSEAREILSHVGLSPDIAKQAPHRLSTGNQRLVAIASALAANSRFLILDEPMAGLDNNNRALVRKALTALEQCALLIISHHPDDLMGLVERLFILDAGRLLYDGSLHEVPLSNLDRVSPPDDLSFFGLLRRFQERYAVNIPQQFYYQQPNPKVLAAMLQKGLER